MAETKQEVKHMAGLKLIFTQDCFGVAREGNPPPPDGSFILRLHQHEANELTCIVNNFEGMLGALEALIAAVKEKDNPSDEGLGSYAKEMIRAEKIVRAAKQGR